MSNLSFSIVAPFYPLETKEKGIPQIYVGFFIASQSISYIFATSLTGKYLKVFGHKKFIIGGILIVILSTVGIGCLEFVWNKTAFIIISFTTKFMLGVGAAMNSVSVFAIIGEFYKDDKEKYIGVLTSSGAIGLVLGPIIGSTLYSIGGYVLPFFVNGAAYFCLWPLISYTIIKLDIQKDD